jgi:fermentation-respiration switch protein FrsA (DUF1100 family)
MEDRFKLGIVSGYFNTFKGSIMGIHHCICNAAPGMAKHFDMADIAMLAFPRPILFQNGSKDHIFPISQTRKAFKELKGRYASLGEADKLKLDVFADGHRWSPRHVNAFYDRWL